MVVFEDYFRIIFAFALCVDLTVGHAHLVAAALPKSVAEAKFDSSIAVLVRLCPALMNVTPLGLIESVPVERARDDALLGGVGLLVDDDVCDIGHVGVIIHHHLVVHHHILLGHHSVAVSRLHSWLLGDHARLHAGLGLHSRLHGLHWLLHLLILLLLAVLTKNHWGY